MKTPKKNTSSNIENAVTVRYIAEHRQATHRDNTCAVTHALLCHLNTFAGYEVCLHDVSETFVRRFTSYLLGRVQPGSVRTYLHKLHAIMEDCLKQHLIQLNPVSSAVAFVPRRENSARSFLSANELNALLAAPCPHYEIRRAFIFACFTGLRLSDIETLCWNNIQTIAGIETIVKMQVKTSREIRIPLNKEALSILKSKNHVSSTDKVFLLPSRTSIAKSIRIWEKNAGLQKHISFHTSRHTFATLAITAGVDIYTVSKLCGHRSVHTTEIYLHIIDKTLQEGVDKISKFLSLNNSQETT